MITSGKERPETKVPQFSTNCPHGEQGCCCLIGRIFLCSEKFLDTKESSVRLRQNIVAPSNNDPWLALCDYL